MKINLSRDFQKALRALAICTLSSLVFVPTPASTSVVEGEETLTASNAFKDANTLVVHALLISSVRSTSPDAAHHGRMVSISNGCGYDTAFFKVEEILVGSYKGTQLAAILQLGEWCEGVWQDLIRDYFITLHWNGAVWEVDRYLSSPLLISNSNSNENANDVWIVEPMVLWKLRSVHALKSERIAIDEKDRIAYTLERLHIMGVAVDDGVVGATSAREVASSCKDGMCWSGAPMLFTRGISLGRLHKFLHDLKPSEDPPQGGQK